MRDRLITRRHDLQLIAEIGLITSLVAWAATIGMLVSAVTMWQALPGLLPDVSDIPGNGLITTVPPSTIEPAASIEIKTRGRDWVPFRNAMGNDVRRHGGWVQQQQTGWTIDYYVPASYLERAQPLIEQAGQHPHHPAYGDWALATLEDARKPAPPRDTVDTIIRVEHDIHMFDRRAGRITIRALMGLGTAAALVTLMAMLGATAGADLARAARHGNTA